MRIHSLVIRSQRVVVCGQCQRSRSYLLDTRDEEDMESAESAVWTRDCNEWKFEDHSGLEAPGFSTFSFPLKFF